VTTEEGTTRVRRRGAVIIANETVYDKSLSYNALGVLAVLLARDESAPKGYRTLMRPGVGQKAILSAFRELREAGYRYQFLRKGKGPDGRARMYTDTYIYESAVSLEMAKRDHFKLHGVEGLETPDRRKSKDTLASLCDAHSCDAHSCDAHSRVAQEEGSSLASDLSGSPSSSKLNQEGADANDENKAPPAAITADEGKPSNDATTKAKEYRGITPEQAERNRRGAALAKAALRGQTSPPAEVLPVEAKDDKDIPPERVTAP
jgi:hypothetical protein